MNTRGRNRKDLEPFDYSHIENPDYRDLREERSRASSVNDGHTSDIASKRAHQRFDRNAEDTRSAAKNPRNVARRFQKGTRAKGGRDKIQKLLENSEFNEVVTGFVGFLEEINRSKKKSNKPKKTETEEKPSRDIIESNQTRKKVNYDVKASSPSLKHDENEGMAAENLKYDKNGLYRFKDDVSNSREFLNILKRDERESAGQTTQTASQAQTGRATRSQTTEPAPSEDFLRSREQLQQLFAMQPDIWQNLALANQGQRLLQRGMPEFGQDTSGMRQLFEMLLSNRPPSYASAPREQTNQMARGNPTQNTQRNQGRTQMEIERPQNKFLAGTGDPKNFKKPFRRACTHVALAYFIYIKSFNNDEAAMEKNMDPTSNARRLKEQKNFPFESEARRENYTVDPRAFAEHMQLERQPHESKKQQAMDLENETEKNVPKKEEKSYTKENLHNDKLASADHNPSSKSNFTKPQSSEMTIEEPPKAETKDENEIKAENASAEQEVKTVEKKQEGEVDINQKVEGEIHTIDEEKCQEQDQIKQELGKEETKHETQEQQINENLSFKDVMMEDRPSENHKNGERLTPEEDHDLTGQPFQEQPRHQEQGNNEKMVEESAEEGLLKEDASRPQEVRDGENNKKFKESDDKAKQNQDMEFEEGEIPREQ